MVYYTREQIRSFIRCPQLGSTDYGEWGALRLEQRLAINSMLDQLDSAEVYIRQLEKENKFWKEYKEKLDKLDTKDFIFKHELENYIPKSVIREKIEELERDEEKIRAKKKEAHDCDRSKARMQAYLTKTNEIKKRLKELLGDEQ